MTVELFVALRYLAASRKRAHVAVITAISVGGLALGVAALIVSISLLTGFQDRIRERLAATTPHLLLTPKHGAYFDDPAAVVTALRSDPAVRSIVPVLEGRGWIGDPEARAVLPIRYRAPASGGPNSGRVVISSAISGQIGVGRGGRVRLSSQRTVLSPLGPIPVSIELRVADVRRGSAIESSTDVEVPYEAAESLAGATGAVSRFEVRLASPELAKESAVLVSNRISGAATVRTWKDLNTGLNFALRLEKTLIFVTVFLVVLVAALNIVSDLALLVVEKRRDLGILATLGAPSASLSKIYWWLGGSIGAIGTLLGAALGVGLSWSLDRFGLIPLPADVYLLSHVPFSVHLRDLVLVLAFSLSTAMAAAILPAKSAARVGPAEALRLSR